VTDPVAKSSANAYARQTSETGGMAPAAQSPGATPGEVVPPAPDAGTDAAPVLPILAAPLKAGGLALEQLVAALGLETRQVNIKTGMETLKANAAEREEKNKEQIEKIQKQLENLKKQEKLGPFMKALKWIGMALSAIASVATIAIGAMTCNPLLVAAGTIMAVMTVNSIVSAATDGEHGIGPWIAKGLEKAGVDKETAQWIGFGAEMLITLVGVGLSFGAGLTSAASKAADAAGSVAKILAKASSATTFLSGVNTMIDAGVSIANSVYEYKIADARADQKLLQAVLERIAAAMESETKFIESIMKRSEKLMGDVKEIIEGNVQTQAAILSGQAPGMA
jgi:hypothetical protein